MFIELHLLQNFSPSCLNRDDTNSPKDCRFGGYRRARISSQCIKRAVRWHPTFQASLKGSLGTRSRLQAKSLAEILEKQGKDALVANSVARYVFEKVGFKPKGEGSAVLLFLGEDEVEALAGALLAAWEDLVPLADIDKHWEDLAEQVQTVLEGTGEEKLTAEAGWLARLVTDSVIGKPTIPKLDALARLHPPAWQKVIDELGKLSDDDLSSLKQLLRQGADEEDAEEESKVPKQAQKEFKKHKDVAKALKSIQPRKSAGSQEDEKKLPESVKQVIKTFKTSGTKAADIALFGRMVAELKKGEHNIDAACQVAHAISTNKFDLEFDYFTAVDDLQKDASGAGMIGTVEFGSSCFYRYANIDMRQLEINLLGKLAKTQEKASASEKRDAHALGLTIVKAFIRAMVEAIPTGKQNSMAAQNPPSLVFAVVRNRGLWSLTNAFVQPVGQAADDLITGSIKRLDAYWAKLYSGYGQDGMVLVRPVFLLEEAGEPQESRKLLNHLKDDQVSTLDQLIDRVMTAIAPMPNGKEPQ